MFCNEVFIYQNEILELNINIKLNKERYNENLEKIKKNVELEIIKIKEEKDKKIKENRENIIKLCSKKLKEINEKSNKRYTEIFNLLKEKNQLQRKQIKSLKINLKKKKNDVEILLEKLNENSYKNEYIYYKNKYDVLLINSNEINILYRDLKKSGKENLEKYIKIIKNYEKTFLSYKEERYQIKKRDKKFNNMINFKNTLLDTPYIGEYSKTFFGVMIPKHIIDDICVKYILTQEEFVSIFYRKDILNLNLILLKFYINVLKNYSYFHKRRFLIFFRNCIVRTKLSNNQINLIHLKKEMLTQKFNTNKQKNEEMKKEYLLETYVLLFKICSLEEKEEYMDEKNEKNNKKVKKTKNNVKQ